MTEFKTTPGGLILPGSADDDSIQLARGTEVREVGEGLTIRTKTGYYMPYPRKHIAPQGLLEDSASQCALWYFLKCADKAIEKLPQQISLEHEEDSAADLVAMADSIATCYGTERQEMFEIANWRRALAEIERVGGIINPKLVAFVNSGGKLYRHHDREPN